MGRCIERIVPLAEIPVYIRLHRAEELLPRFRLADLQVAHLG
jgi:hypothetical protein